MKKLILLAGLSFFSLHVSAQGWIGGSATELYPVNSGLGLTPLNVGIGTSTPTEQLHTNEGVRFEGLTQDDKAERVVTQDNTGKLFWRDLSSIISPTSGDFWSLTGNAGTNPGVGLSQNYLGTTDPTRLVFATNATERMTILPTGQVGIGNTNPTIAQLTVGDGNAGIGAQGNQLYTFSVLGQGTNAVEHLGMFNNDQRTSRSQVTVSNSGNGRWEDNFISIMVHGDNFSFNNQNNYYLGQNNSGFAMINAQSNAASNVPLKKFSIGVRSGGVPMSFYTNNTERVFINAAGQTGFATVAPTAALHVNCTGIPAANASNVRFENLQQGSGNILVIDANGYVRRSSGSASSQEGEGEEEIELKRINSELADTKRELNELKAQVQALLKAQHTSGDIRDNVNGNTLEIAPTPFSDNAKAIYRIADFKGDASLEIIDAKGSLIRSFPIRQSEGQIELGSINAASGTVVFHIISKGKSIISKKSIKL